MSNSLPVNFDSPEALKAFLAHYGESPAFRKWSDALLDWAERNMVEVHPVRRSGDWCFKVVMHDAKGRFFDYVEMLRGKKGEGDEGYSDRLWKALNAECAAIRRIRQENVVKDNPEVKANRAALANARLSGLTDSSWEMRELRKKAA